jgi:hypothetical protein
MRTLLLVLGLVLIAATPALADEIRLKNGSTIQGRIVREDPDFVTIDLGRGRMSIARRDILSVVRTVPPAPDTGSPDERRPRETAPPPDRAVTPRKADPRTTVSNSRKRGKSTPTGPNPKIVPVERVPSRTPHRPGPESVTPSRSTSRTARAPTNQPDW